jgi:predicted MFS family arabinose efflux permease
VQSVIVAPQQANTFGVAVWRASLAGLCAVLIGIGLGRFAYTPLFPALIGADWVTPAQAAYLGAANLAGYLAGALVARPIAVQVSPVIVLRTMMLVAAASFFACAYPLSYLWFCMWRFAAGLAGGVLMVLAAPTILPHVPVLRRGLVSGVIFTGVGIGIAASGTLVPLLLGLGVVESWLTIGSFALLLTAVAWTGWPRQKTQPTAEHLLTQAPRESRSPQLISLYVEYGLTAVGLVPHVIFLVDFIARGLHHGIDVGANFWILFGVGAMVVPLVFGQVADRIGFKAALRVAFLMQATSVALITISPDPVSLIVSSVMVGGFVTGTTALTLGRLHELIPDADRCRKAWGMFTTIYAVGQAGAAYGFSYIFAQTDGQYHILFSLAAGALSLAFAIDLCTAAVVHNVRARASA